MDTESNAVTNRIDTIGDSGSTHIAFTPDGSRAYATGSEPGDSTFAIFANAENTVEMIDTPDKTWDVAVHPDGTRAYITSFANNNISVIDALSVALISIDRMRAGHARDICSDASGATEVSNWKC